MFFPECRACAKISQFGADKCRTFSRLNVLEVNNAPDASIYFNR
jgi:hypothetical protein